MKKLCIYLNDSSLVTDNTDCEAIEYLEMVSIAKSKDLKSKIFLYNELYLYTRKYSDLPAPFLSLSLCKLLCRGKCYWLDSFGGKKRISFLMLVVLFYRYIKEHIKYKRELNCIQGDVTELSNKSVGDVLDKNGHPLYLRLDMTFGIVAGGSVGHIAGVVNSLNKIGNAPLIVSTDLIPTIDKSIESSLIDNEIPYRNVNGMTSFAGNLVTYPIICSIIENNSISFIYQRSGLNIYSGVKAAINYGFPYVLEYNGSEIWCEEHWGSNQLLYQGLSKKIEQLTLEKASLITCVSSPLRDQLVEMGIDSSKIIVNPNGVDPQRYNPQIDGEEIRRKYKIDKEKIVIGFIGTFGAWHGADILASAYVDLAKKLDNIHLLMIGDGSKMNEVKKVLSYIDESRYTLTGLVPQKEGAVHLAACDILVNPTIPNPDGTPFFGSPTKMFEYMAMGKAIVASGMDQMAEVLVDGETALLTQPGEVTEIIDAIDRLIHDEVLRKKLGENARKEVCDKYTWEIHTKKIVDKLKEILM